MLRVETPILLGDPSLDPVGRIRPLREQCFQIPNPVAADAQFSAVAQRDSPCPRGPRRHFANMLEVYQVAAIYGDKAALLEHLFEFANGAVT